MAGASVLELTAVVSYTSGTPYTPLVGGDINGDGSSNDRGRSSTTPRRPVGHGDRQRHEPAARRGACHASGVASSRRSARSPDATRCTTMWTPNVSMQINYRPDRFGLKRNLMISFALTNPIAGMDLLLHGQNNLQGWGQPVRANSQLLYVTGFNSGDEQLHLLGEREVRRPALQPADHHASRSGAVDSPLHDRARLCSARRSSPRRRPPAAGTRTPRRPTRWCSTRAWCSATSRTSSGPSSQRADTLKLDLTAPQITLLTVLADSLVHQIDTLGLKVAAKMRSIGNNADPGGGAGADARHLRRRAGAWRALHRPGADHPDEGAMGQAARRT